MAGEAQLNQISQTLKSIDDQLKTHNRTLKTLNENFVEFTKLFKAYTEAVQRDPGGSGVGSARLPRHEEVL